MDWIAILNGAAGAGALAVVLKVIDSYLNRNKTKADAAKVLVEGGAQAVQTMRELLADYDRVNDKQASKIEKLEARLKDRDKASAQRDADLADLQQKYEDLEAQNIKIANKARETDEKVQRDTEETQRLRNDYALVQKDNIRLYEVTIGLAQALETIKKAVQEAGIPLKLNGELDHLLESVYRLKAEREQRGAK
jgi:dihydroorotase-like cyclic amidohydrolase